MVTITAQASTAGDGSTTKSKDSVNSVLPNNIRRLAIISTTANYLLSQQSETFASSTSSSASPAPKCKTFTAMDSSPSRDESHCTAAQQSSSDNESFFKDPQAKNATEKTRFFLQSRFEFLQNANPRLKSEIESKEKELSLSLSSYKTLQQNVLVKLKDRLVELNDLKKRHWRQQRQILEMKIFFQTETEFELPKLYANSIDVLIEFDYALATKWQGFIKNPFQNVDPEIKKELEKSNSNQKATFKSFSNTLKELNAEIKKLQITDSNTFESLLEMINKINEIRRDRMILLKEFLPIDRVLKNRVLNLSLKLPEKL